MSYIDQDAIVHDIEAMITARNRIVSGSNAYSKEAKDKAHIEKRLLTQIKCMLNNRKYQIK
jgi:hypothetical protein